MLAIAVTVLEKDCAKLHIRAARRRQPIAAVPAGDMEGLVLEPGHTHAAVAADG
jgi:hypothetical protein